MSLRRALLIGIDRYPHVPPLDGCVNDVRLMRGVLVETFGFPTAGITLLTDAQATRAGILSAFDALIDATGADDVVVVHFAGHGSRMTDREGDEPSGFDSTIVPVDSGRDPIPNRDISDDEIHLNVAALAAKTPFTTLIFDACHSGTIARDAFGARARTVEADRRPPSGLPPSPIHAAVRRTRSGASGWLPHGDKYVLIAGCRDEERSYEYRPPEGGGAIAHGALTYFLCQELRRALTGTTYRDVFERAASRVTAENAEQHPQMEGRSDREIFGIADVVPQPFVLVRSRSDGRVEIAAGAAQGLTRGSSYRVYPQGAKGEEADAALGDLEVTAVRATTSDARITRETIPGTIAPGTRALESAHAYGDFRLAVQIDDSGDSRADLQTLRGALGRSPRVTVVSADQPASARIYLLEARIDVGPAAPVPQAGALAESRWAVVSATGDLLMPLKAPADVDAVVVNLETIARYRQVLATDNPDPRSRLRGRIDLDLLRRGPDGTWTPAHPETDGGHVAFEEGEPVAFRITNRHHRAVFVALLDLGVSGAVSVVTQGATVAPGIAWDIGTEGNLLLGFPDGYPFVDSADHLREAAAIETLKLFATHEPADFDSLEHGGVRSTASASALATLLHGAMHGGTTRDITITPVGREDWTSVSRSFLLRRRRSAPLRPGEPVSLGGAALSAPGLSGHVTVRLGKREREEAARDLTDALRQALDRTGMETKQTLAISQAREAGPGSRGAEPAAVELTLPAPGAGYGQVVMAVDELGVVTWCLPSETGEATRSADRSRRTRTFVVPGGVPGEAPAPGGRGLIGAAGHKVLTELVFPLLDPVLGEVGATFVHRAERRWTPYRLRTFTPDDYAQPEAATLGADDWTRMASGRALLLVHGTLSRSHLAFARWPKDEIRELHRLYDGRVFAFDHFTLSHDPKENIRRFVAQLPDNAVLTLDIVSHSRGGLVSRMLAEKQSEISLGGRTLRVGKVVLVGVPCVGTVLAVPDHLKKVADVFTNLMNFLPDNGVTETMTLVMSLLKQLAVGTVKGLDGLQSMDPDGEFRRWLNTGARTADTRYFAVASNVTPVDPGLRRFVVRYGLNRLFGCANDLVVPFEGVFAANGSGYFPIDEKLALEGSDAAAHTAYFGDPRVRRQIVAWLSPR